MSNENPKTQSVTIELSAPIPLNGVTVNRLHLRRPKLKDIRTARLAGKDEKLDPNLAKNMISKAKNNGWSAPPDDDTLIGSVYRRYDQELRALNAMGLSPDQLRNALHGANKDLVNLFFEHCSLRSSFAELSQLLSDIMSAQLGNDDDALRKHIAAAVERTRFALTDKPATRH